MLNVIYDKNSKQIITFSVVLLALCLILLFFGIFRNETLCLVFAIAILINLPFLLIEKGIEFDKKNNEYRMFRSIFNLKFYQTNWQTLPNIQYVSLFKAKKSQEEPMGVNYNHSYFYIYEITIFNEYNHFVLFQIEINYLNHAVFCSKQIAKYLQVPLLDATTFEHKWITTQ